MPAKKTPQKAKQKPLSGSLKVTDKEKAELKRRAEADMKRHGFKTVEELMDFYDSKRGY